MFNKTRKFNKPTRVLLLTALLSQSALAELSTDAFEEQLDVTIRSVCHGYMVDALPDFLSDARDWLNENSPFCQTIRTLPDSQSAYGELKRQNPGTDYSQDPNYRIKYLSGYNEELYRQADCDDWMCEHVRNQAYSDGHPVSLSDYRKVEQYCEKQYGCIESWFKTWPRPLPEPRTQESGLSLDSLMAGEVPSSPQAQTQQPAGLTLDALLGSAGNDKAEASERSAPVNQNSPSTASTLDEMFGTPAKPKAPEPETPQVAKTAPIQQDSKPEQVLTSTVEPNKKKADTAASTPANTHYAICKIEGPGPKMIAGCVGFRVEDNGNTACSGANCADSLALLCRQVGAEVGVPFEWWASGNGTFSGMDQCIAKCENGYGEANWGQYGSKCLGAVAY